MKCSGEEREGPEMLRPQLLGCDGALKIISRLFDKREFIQTQTGRGGEGRESRL